VGLQMCCDVRGLLIGAFLYAPKRRNARGVKKIKTLCREVSKKALIQALFLFAVIFKLAVKSQKSGVWLAPNVPQIHAGREFPDELPTKICTLNY